LLATFGAPRPAAESNAIKQLLSARPPEVIRAYSRLFAAIRGYSRLKIPTMNISIAQTRSDFIVIPRPGELTHPPALGVCY